MCSGKMILGVSEEKWSIRPPYLYQLSSAQIMTREGLFLLLTAPGPCLAKVAPQCVPAAATDFPLIRRAGAAIGWEGWHPGDIPGEVALVQQA